MESEERYISTFWTGRLRRRGLLGTGLAGAAAVALAGCGARAKPGRTSQTSATAGQPRPGGTLNVGIPSDPYNWDPTYAGVGSGATYHLVYNSVLGYRNGPWCSLCRPQGAAGDGVELGSSRRANVHLPFAQGIQVRQPCAGKRAGCGRRRHQVQLLNTHPEREWWRGAKSPRACSGAISRD